MPSANRKAIVGRITFELTETLPPAPTGWVVVDVAPGPHEVATHQERLRYAPYLAEKIRLLDTDEAWITLEGTTIISARKVWG